MVLAERVIEMIVSWLEKELQDPAFVADVETLLTEVNNWLEMEIASQESAPQVAQPSAPQNPTQPQSQNPVMALRNTMRGGG